MTALGVLCCFALFVCLTLLASFFLPSHLSFKNMYIQRHCTILYVYIEALYNPVQVIAESAGGGGGDSAERKRRFGRAALSEHSGSAAAQEHR